MSRRYEGGYMKQIIVCLILTLALTSISYADETSKYNGETLLRNLDLHIRFDDPNANPSPVGHARTWEAVGFVMGVVDSNTYYQSVAQVNKDNNLLIYFCIPDEATNGQILKNVMKYLNDNPDKLNKSRILLTYDALKTYYPCK